MAAQSHGRFNLDFSHVVLDNKLPPAGQKFHGDCKAAGDIDGDGNPDIILAGSTLAWYAYPDWRRTEIATAENQFTTDMQVGDVDGDGDLDVIVPDGPLGKLAWFENPRPKGDPKTSHWERHLIGEQGTWAHDLEVADINHDGKLDIVTRKDQTILWLQRNPNEFQRIVISTAMENGEGLALADLNADGRVDMLQNGYWLEAPHDPANTNWKRRNIVGNMPRQVAVSAADINADGRLDVLLAPAESRGRLSWFEAPSNLDDGAWVEHAIDPDVDFMHTFKIADVNNDGLPDLVTAEMQQSSRKRVSVYYFDKKTWKQQVIARTGSHNVRIADIGSDGDIDIIGANWGGDYHPLELWENKLIDRSRQTIAPGWSHVIVDSARGKWGDFASPPWLRYLGLATGDVDGNGLADIASGRYFYRNPGENSQGPWGRVDFGLNADAMLMTDVDGDGRNDVIAEALPNVYWLKPEDRDAEHWKAIVIGTVPPTPHINSQGYALGQIVSGGKPEIILSGGDAVYSFEIPDAPAAGNWPRTRLTAGTSEEGIGVGDVDRDGFVDISASDKDGRTIAWWKNPGKQGGEWAKHTLGKTMEWADRMAMADINGDGRLDVVVTEETPYDGASIYWFEQPANASDGNWTRHTTAIQFTTNSMDAVDFDNDGDIDLLTNEHRGMRRLTFWENRGQGKTWVEHVLDIGKEGHLGARVADLYHNGQLAILSPAWDTYSTFHLWHPSGAVAAKARQSDWGRVSVRRDHNGHLEAILENRVMQVVYGWRKFKNEEGMITDMHFQASAAENNAVNRLDAAAGRGRLCKAYVVRDDNERKAVHLEWNDLSGGAPSAEEVSISTGSAVLRIDYLNWNVNTVDIGSPGGATDGTYAIVGAEKWKRPYVLYPKAYFDGAPTDVGHENITEVDQAKSLDYRGWFIMGVFNAANGRGFGRVVPSGAIDIIKLLSNRGFELFPYYKRDKEAFTSLFLSRDGAGGIKALAASGSH